MPPCSSIYGDTGLPQYWPLEIGVEKRFQNDVSVWGGPLNLLSLLLDNFNKTKTPPAQVASVWSWFLEHGASDELLVLSLTIFAPKFGCVVNVNFA